MKQRRKNAVTLIEIMIVILLIGLIGGALAINMRGSMDQGKVFKTRQNISRVYDVLMMEYASGTRSLEQIVSGRVQILEKSPLLKEGSKLLKDAWGKNLSIKIENEDLVIESDKLKKWDNDHKS